MISKNKAKRSYLRMLLIVPVTLACLCMFAVNVESKPISTPDPQPVLADEPDPQPTPGPQRPNENEMKYEEVQVKPLFNGGDANGFSRWVAEQIVYPKEAQDKNIQGRVILQFKIGASGSIEDINLLRGVDSLLDNEALRVVSLSPRWTPGKQDGKNVRVIYTFPINFTLSENDDPKPVASNSSFTYDEVQVKPLFEDKDINGFSQWVTERIVYPKEAMDKNIQGRVVISFKIGVDGKLTDMKILRSVDPLLDKEAMRVISSSPAWTPAQQNGMKVCVIYNFPVNFSLSEST